MPVVSAPVSIGAICGLRVTAMCRYNICTIQPTGYAHSRCFLELAVLLHASLRTMGYPVEMTKNRLDPAATNIILGYHLIPSNVALRGYRYVIYQLEQLSRDEGWFNATLRDRLAGAHAVWDFSQENVRFLDALGIKATLLPVGYHAALETIEPDGVPDIDILFYGSVNDRRKAVLERLACLDDVAVKILFGVYGADRDAWIARSRIVLNIHHYEQQLFEAVRVSYLLNNRCLVVSETSAAYPYTKVRLPLVSQDRIADVCARFLRHEDHRNTYRTEMYEAFRQHYAMTDLLGAAMEKQEQR